MTQASTWAPLRHRVFLALWIAQLASNVGSFMQNVGAAWLMGDLGGSALAVASIQAATTFPVVLLGLPGGALADLFDRRRLLILTQAGMLIAAAALAALSFADLTTQVSLVALTFALGLGAALNIPAWQAIQPDLVPRGLFPQAIALGSVSANIGRAAGPALGGLAVAAGGPELVFLLNALSFVGVMFVLFGWRPDKKLQTSPRETLAGAIRAGLRYATHSQSVRAVLVRTALFVLPGSAIMALLPVLARGPLDVGAVGFGVLYGCFGAGAVAGALVLARLRTRTSSDGVIAASAIATALSLAGLATVHVPAVAALALLIGGAGWTLGISMLNVAAMGCLPEWVRARGMGLTMLVLMGVISAGSIGWGVLADRGGVTQALAIAAVTTALPLLAVLRWQLEPYERLDMSSGLAWPDPVVVVPPQPGRRAVLVTVTYVVHPDDHDGFVDAMRGVERLRRRTGARRWGLWQDVADHDSYVETFVVESWEEHLRQHQRVTTADELVTDTLARFHGQTTLSHHFISAY
jgi:MFS family permease